MKVWSRRFVFLLIFFVWLIIMSFPLLAVWLAMEREIQLGNDPRNQLRLFLIQESNAEGVALQWTRSLGQPEACAQTNVFYLMWKGDGENVIYCRCYNNGAALESDSGRCVDNEP